MKKGSPYNRKRSAKPATQSPTKSPTTSTASTSTALLELDAWDSREMCENAIEACVYQVMSLAHPVPLTAEEIVAKLKEHNSIATKDEVGDAL